jgi:hypothetical protein
VRPVTPARNVLTMVLCVGWLLAVETVSDGWPEMTAGAWAIWLGGFVVITVVWIAVDKAIVRSRERQQ